jgi:nucleoside-diphosphate-sugar epimerase
VHILITGASGYIGSRLCRLLTTNSQNKIFSLQRSSLPSQDGITVIKWDLSDPIDETVLPAKIDAVVHLALARDFRLFPEGVEDLFSINVRTTMELLEYARKVEASRFFMASTGNSYAPDIGLKIGEKPEPPNDFYTASKLAAEALCRSYRSCFPINILRVFFPYGPYQDDKTVQRLISSVREGRPILLGRGPDGNGDHLSLIYVDDLVQVIKLSIDEGWNGLFDVAASEVQSVRNIANEIGKQLGTVAVFEEAEFTAKDMLADLKVLNEKNKKILRNFSNGLSALLEQEKSES